jgi:hypothetical protein
MGTTVRNAPLQPDQYLPIITDNTYYTFADNNHFLRKT